MNILVQTTTVLKNSLKEALFDQSSELFSFKVLANLMESNYFKIY